MSRLLQNNILVLVEDCLCLLTKVNDLQVFTAALSLEVVILRQDIGDVIDSDD